MLVLSEEMGWQWVPSCRLSPAVYAAPFTEYNLSLSVCMCYHSLTLSLITLCVSVPLCVCEWC